MYYYSIMKEHISITINEKTLDRLRKYAVEEKRTLSQVMEMAAEEYLAENEAAGEGVIVASEGSFQGSFSREETYDR